MLVYFLEKVFNKNSHNLKKFFRIIDEDIEEGEIAVVVVKEGEKVSVFRVPSSVSPSSSAISTANLHTASLSSHQVTSKGETSSKFASSFSERQRHIDNKKTYQTMEMIRNKLNQKKRSQLPPLPTRVKVKIFIIL